jgi:hypothetical protein
MSKKKKRDFQRTVLRILGTIILFGYLGFFFDEIISSIKSTRAGMNFEEISVFLLFVLFLIGYYFLWTREIIAGILILVWHAIQWILVFTVWPDGGMTLIMGLPVGIFGLFVLIYGIRKKSGRVKS